MIKSLGKKEGELAGFREQLDLANQALRRSEEALEVRKLTLLSLIHPLYFEHNFFFSFLKQQKKICCFFPLRSTHMHPQKGLFT